MFRHVVEVRRTQSSFLQNTCTIRSSSYENHYGLTVISQSLEGLKTYFLHQLLPLSAGSDSVWDISVFFSVTFSLVWRYTRFCLRVQTPFIYLSPGFRNFAAFRSHWHLKGWNQKWWDHLKDKLLLGIMHLYCTGITGRRRWTGRNVCFVKDLMQFHISRNFLGFVCNSTKRNLTFWFKVTFHFKELLLCLSLDIITLKCLSGTFYLCLFLFFFSLETQLGGHVIGCSILFFQSHNWAYFVLRLVLHWECSNLHSSKMDTKTFSLLLLFFVFVLKDMKHPKHRDREATQGHPRMSREIFMEVSKCYLCLI